MRTYQVQYIPLLTLLCVEEPENHLSPQHLGRVIREFRSIAARSNGQVLITTHSTAPNDSTQWPR